MDVGGAQQSPSRAAEMKEYGGLYAYQSGTMYLPQGGESRKIPISSISPTAEVKKKRS